MAEVHRKRGRPALDELSRDELEKRVRRLEAVVVHLAQLERLASSDDEVFHCRRCHIPCSYRTHEMSEISCCDYCNEWPYCGQEHCAPPQILFCDTETEGITQACPDCVRVYGLEPVGPQGIKLRSPGEAKA